MRELKTQITKDGQRFVDRAVYDYLCPKDEDVLQSAVKAAFGDRQKPLETIHVFVRHDRIRLRWMKPDGNGGLVPR